MCIRVQDAALSCTAAGTDAQWAHTRRVQSSLIFISAGPGVVDYQFVQRVVSHPKRTETTESWCTKYVTMEGLASWPISASNHLHLMHSAAWDICHLIKSPKSHGLRWQGTGEIWEWSGTIVMSRSLFFWEPSLKHIYIYIPAKSSVVQWLGLATLKMQATKTPKHEFRHNVQTQISSKSNESLAGLKCKSTSMEDSFQIFTKALVCFARRDFGSIGFLVAILVSCLLPMCRRWKPLFSLHSNKRLVSISNLLARQTKRQDCILNHHILQALNYKGLEVNPVFHPTCVLRRICILVSASR